MPGCAASGWSRRSGFPATSSTSPTGAAGGGCGCRARRWTGWSTCWSCGTRTRAARPFPTRQPAPGGGSVRRQVGGRVPGLPAAGLAQPAGRAGQRHRAGDRQPAARQHGPRLAVVAGALAADEPAPLLVAHDGPEYATLAGLTTFAGALIDDGRLPPLRVALLAPGDRNRWYAVSPAYARALTGEVLPALAEQVPSTVRIGMGASLGALAMLHAHRLFPTGRPPGRVVPAVRQLLRRPFRRARTALRQVRTGDALRPGGDPGGGRPATGPGPDDLRDDRGEPGQQPGDGRGAGPAGLRRAAGRGSATCTTTRPGGMPSTPTWSTW